MAFLPTSRVDVHSEGCPRQQFHGTSCRELAKQNHTVILGRREVSKRDFVIIIGFQM